MIDEPEEAVEYLAVRRDLLSVASDYSGTRARPAGKAVERGAHQE
jgi:hypothetical protein